MTGGAGRAGRAKPIVAIDGPAGAGKSTVARRLAAVLGFVLVDTGAIYRAVALAAKQRGVAWDDAERTAALARGLAETRALTLGQSADGGVQVRLDQADVSDAIRTAEIGMGASTGVVLEGRDIGTVVFPDADVKFFLTARAEVRARRRYEELTAKGARVTLEETLADVLRRDDQDSTRPVAPLRQAADATLVDDSDLTIAETVTRMADGVRAWRPA